MVLRVFYFLVTSQNIRRNDVRDVLGIGPVDSVFLRGMGYRAALQIEPRFQLRSREIFPRISLSFFG